MLQNVQLVLLLSAVGAFAQMCPPAADLSPCTCEEANLKITCRNILGQFDIKGVFDRVSSMVDDSVVFKTLEISDTSLQSIPVGSIESLKFREIYITSNQYLEEISPEAFNATTAVTTELSFENNRISNAPPHERDIFDLLQKFTALESVSLSGNQIQSIPDLAFGPSTALLQIDLGYNDLCSIGSKVFSFEQVPNLENVYIAYNNLSVDCFVPDTFVGVTDHFDIEMQFNRITYLPETIFKPLLDEAFVVRVGDSDCSVDCTYLDCNENADWICQNVALYERKLLDFMCTPIPNGPNYTTVWDYCADQFGNELAKER